MGVNEVNAVKGDKEVKEDKEVNEVKEVKGRYHWMLRAFTWKSKFPQQGKAIPTARKTTSHSKEKRFLRVGYFGER